MNGELPLAPLLLIGVDPAPSKDTLVVTGSSASTAEWVQLAAHDLKGSLANTVKGKRTLVAWDAPISFDPALSYSDRPIDKAIRAVVAQQVKAGRLNKGAVAALPFSGCSHWAITCDVLGMPYGAGDYTIVKDATELANTHRSVIEVHPAVTVALWWLADRTGAMPRYKPGGKLKRAEVKANRESLVPMLVDRTGLDPSFFDTDDMMDASVAWAMARDFALGDAVWVGDPARGGYVLPRVEAEFWDLRGRVATSWR